MTSTTALSIAQAIQERALASKKAEMAKPVLQRRAIKPIQIPLWDNSALAVQFDIARSALFSAKSRGKRKYFADEIIPSLSHLKILYRGEELRQRDFDVYLEILSLARGQHITSENPWTRFTARSLVRELGWTANNVSLNELRQIISRLIACNIQVTRKDNGIERSYGYSGLLERMAGVVNDNFNSETEAAKDWAVIINTEIAEQIRPGLYTKVDKNIRKKLSPLGKWLQSYYSTHSKPYPIKIESIQELSGSLHYSKSQFKYILKDEMEVLRSLNFFTSYTISAENLVSVIKGLLYGQIGRGIE